MRVCKCVRLCLCQDFVHSTLRAFKFTRQPTTPPLVDQASGLGAGNAHHLEDG